MNTDNVNTDNVPPNSEDEIPAEIDFSGGVRGKFYRSDAKLNLPVYLDRDVVAYLAAIAAKKGVALSDVRMTCSRRKSRSSNR